MNLIEVLRKIFSQPQDNDESLIPSERLTVMLQKLSECRHEMMMSPHYHADFVPTGSDVLNAPKVLLAYEQVSRLTTKIEFLTELLQTPDQMSEQRLERVLRALFWHYDAIIADTKLDDLYYYELFDSLNCRIEVAAQLLQIPRQRTAEVLLIIIYYHTGIKNEAIDYYHIIHKWINKAEGTFKTLALPPHLLSQSREQNNDHWAQTLKRSGDA
jgi:hypothetical protein